MIGLDGLRLGSLVWLYRAHHYLTVVAKATHGLAGEDGLGPSVTDDVRPFERAGRPHEMLPALSRTDVVVRSRRDGQLHLGVYRGQQPLLQKSGTAAELAPRPATKPPRAETMATINGGGLWRLPDDLDWSALQAAPPDQQLPFLNGGEWVVVGATGDSQATRFQVPARPPEVVVRGIEVEVPTPTLDTIHIDLDAPSVTLLWRIRIPIDSPAALTSMTVLARLPTDDPFPEEAGPAQNEVKRPGDAWTPLRKLSGEISPQKLSTTMNVSTSSAGEALPFQPGVAITGAEDAGPASQRLADVAISFQGNADESAPVDLGQTLDGHQAPPERAPLPFEAAKGAKTAPPRREPAGGLPFAGASSRTGTAPPKTLRKGMGLPFAEARPAPPPQPPQPGPAAPSPAAPPLPPPPVAVPTPEPVAVPAPFAPPPVLDAPPAPVPNPPGLEIDPRADDESDDVPSLEEAERVEDVEAMVPSVAPVVTSEEDRFERNFYNELKEQQQREIQRQHAEAEARDEAARREREGILEAERDRAKQIADTLYSFRLKQ